MDKRVIRVKRRWIATLLVLVLVAGVVYIRMPDVAADNEKIPVKMQLDDIFISNSEVFLNISKDADECYQLPNPILEEDYREIYEFIGWEYQGLINDKGESVDGSSDTYFVEAAQDGATNAFREKENATTISLTAKWKLLSGACNVTLNYTNDGEAYSSDSWSNQELTFSLDVATCVTGASVSYMCVTGESIEAITDIAWNEEAKIPFESTPYIISVVPEEAKTVVAKYIFKIEDSLRSESYIADGHIVKLYKGEPVAIVDITGEAVQITDRENAYYYKAKENVYANITAIANESVGLKSVSIAAVGIEEEFEADSWQKVFPKNPSNRPWQEEQSYSVSNVAVNLDEQDIKIGLWVVDNAGNESITVKELLYDGTAPSLVTAKANLNGKYLFDHTAYTSQEFSINAEASDSGSGIKYINITAGQVKATTNESVLNLVVSAEGIDEGEFPLEIKAEDQLGNYVEVTEVAVEGEDYTINKVILDKIAPKAVMKVTSTDGIWKDNILYIHESSKPAVQVSLSDIIDNTSGAGVNRIIIRADQEIITKQAVDCYSVTADALTVQQVLTVSGEAIIAAELTDNVENTAVVTGYSVKVDKTAPMPVECSITKSPVNTIINILTFGFFSNTDVTVSLKAEDTESGVQSVELFDSKDSRSLGKEEGAELTVSLKETYQDRLKVRTIDKVGNSKVYELNEYYNLCNNKEVKKNQIIIDEKAPVLELEVTGPALYQKGDNALYYAQSVDRISALVHAEDQDSYISQLETGVSADGVVTSANMDTYSEEITKAAVISSLDQVLSPNQYNHVWVNAKDNAGNIVTKEGISIGIDIIPPKVNRFEFQSLSGAQEEGEPLMVEPEKTTYGYFFNSDVTVKVYANEVEADKVQSGVTKINFQAIDQNEENIIVSESSVEIDSEGAAYFTVPAGFKGQIYAQAVDYVGNVGGFVNPEGVITETEEEHKNHARVSAELQTNNTAMTVGNTHNYPLFNKDVRIQLSAEDSYSGIYKMYWRIIVDGKTNRWGTTEYDLNGIAISGVAIKPEDKDFINEDSIAPWTVEANNQDNLVYRIGKTLTVSEEGDEIYVEMVLIDRAGNCTKYESESFSIDKTAPVISESNKLKLLSPTYTNNTEKRNYYRGATDNVGIKLGADDRKGNIGSGIKELEVSVIKHKDNEKDLSYTTTIPYSTNNNRELSFFNKDLTVRDDIIHLEELEEGNYTINAKVTDQAGNVANYDPVSFSVDTKSPEIVNYTIERKETAGQHILRILTFGIYSNDSVRLVVHAQDAKGKINSGIEEIKVYDEVTSRYLQGSYTNQNKDFTVDLEQFDDNGRYNLQFITCDNVGNESQKMNLNELRATNSNRIHNEIILEKIKPTINEFSITGEKYNNGSQNWYSSYNDILVNFKVGDFGKNISGLNSVKLSMNNKNLDRGWSVDYGNSTTKQQTYANGGVLATQTGYSNENGDGSVRVTLTVEDNAGNNNEQIKTVFVDEEAPYVTQFEFHAVDYKEGSETPVSREDYGFFFNQTTNVTVHTMDHAPSSGIQSTTLRLVDTNGNIVKEETKQSSDGTAIFTVDAGFKGQIYAKARDNVGHEPSESGYVHPDGVVAETQEQHIADAVVEISRPFTAQTAVNGLELYSGDVPLTMTVKDHVSGIRTVEWQVIADGVMVQSATANIDINGNINDDFGWSKAGERNLTTEMAKAITVDNNANQIRVWVRLTDRSGYVTESENIFSIDKTAPLISVTYDNNTPDAANSEYFKEMRQATIVVTERNFDPNNVIINITNTDQSMPSISDWSEMAGAAANGDDTKHMCVINYKADGDYTFTMSLTDRAGYINEPINYNNSVAPEKFTIDQTLPTITISYDNNNLVNGNYSKTVRTATITVNEHNFNAADFQINFSAVDGTTPIEFPAMSSFSNEGDIHKATIHFSKDGEYRYSVTYTDMAGNVGEPPQEEDFYIDLKAPSIKVSNGGETILDTSTALTAQKDIFIKGEAISPIVEVLDRNFDKRNCSVVLQKRNGTQIEYTMAGMELATGSGNQYTFEALKDTKEEDGVYQLIMSVTDQAGNLTTQEWDFRVNRHGTQLKEDEVKNLSNIIYNGDSLSINGKRDQKFKLTLKSVVELSKSKIRIMLGTTELKDNQYQLSDSIQLEDGMYEYTIEILASAFSKDGDYRLAVYVLDDTNEERELMSFWNQSIDIVVDSVAPVCQVRDLTDGETYRALEKSFEIVVDDYHLDKIQVKLNDGEWQEFDVKKAGENGNLNQSGDSEYTLKYTVAALDSTDAQTIEISCMDIAEHESKEFQIEGRNGSKTAELASFYVTDSTWIVFVAALKRNMVWYILGTVVVVAAVAGIIILRVYQKKKVVQK